MMQFCEVCNKTDLLRKRVLLHTLAHSNSVKRKEIDRRVAELRQSEVDTYFYGKNATIRDRLAANMRY